MRPSALLLLLLSVRTFAGEASAPPPADQLLRLEKNLTRKLEERKQGALPPDQYRQFAADFRVELDKALAQSPDTPVNRGRHAMILARLDESGPGQAVAGLDRALEASPDDAALLNAKGTIQLQQGDYAGALASAEAVLKKNQERSEAPDPEALAIRQFSKGRGATAGRSSPADPPASAAPNEASPPIGRTPIQYTQRQARQKFEIPELSGGGAIQAGGPGVGSRGMSWVRERVDKTKQQVVRRIDRAIGLRPGEEAVALTGATYGAVAVGGLGAVGAGAVGTAACAPALATAAPYALCVGAAGAGGFFVGAPLGAFSVGTVAVYLHRFKLDFVRQLDELGYGTGKKSEEP